MEKQVKELWGGYLMKLKSVILTIILGIFYPFSLLFKVRRNRITFISLEHANLSKDFRLLYDRLQRDSEYDLQTVLFKFEPDFWGNLRYGLACIRQLFLIQSSRLVIIDYNNFVVSRFPHKKKVKVLQLWHATGALKQFGNDVDRDYVIHHYDYVIANSDFFKPIYSRAFNIPESCVKVTGIPNNDKIFKPEFVEKTKKHLLEKYPELRGKTVITYAPTFRGRISTRFKEAKIDLEALHQKLGNDYEIIYKAHPLIAHSKYAENPNVLFIKDELISSIFCVTDILISDYSAITIDWMAFNKPVVAYVPDLKKYAHKPGLNIDYMSEFPGAVVKDEEGLVKALKAGDIQEDQQRRARFTNKMYKYLDGEATGRVFELIKAIMDDKKNDG